MLSLTATARDTWGPKDMLAYSGTHGRPKKARIWAETCVDYGIFKQAVNSVASSPQTTIKGLPGQWRQLLYAEVAIC